MIVLPNKNQPIADDLLIPTQRMRGWMESITALVESLEILEGNGSPETVVFASKKKLYFNLTGGAGTTVYIKTTDSTVNTGWLAIG